MIELKRTSGVESKTGQIRDFSEKKSRNHAIFRLLPNKTGSFNRFLAVLAPRMGLFKRRFSSLISQKNVCKFRQPLDATCSKFGKKGGGFG
jgi:hypothetical protein